MGAGSRTETDGLERFYDVMADAVEILDNQAMPYVVFGSIAAAHYGRGDTSEDVDLLVRPRDADRALAELARAGFETERAEPAWMYKATRDGVLVDLIFQVRGGVYLDDDLLGHAREVEIESHPVRVIGPEDLLLIEALANAAQTPTHWYTAVSILLGTSIDWSYLRRRARLAPKRLLSLLVYVESEDTEIPHDVIRDLWTRGYPTEVALAAPREPSSTNR